MISDPDKCGVTLAEGTCQKPPPEPIGCASVYDPVCGCGSQTYSSRCAAEYRWGNLVMHAGECARESEEPETAPAEEPTGPHRGRGVGQSCLNMCRDTGDVKFKTSQCESCCRRGFGPTECFERTAIDPPGPFPKCSVIMRDMECGRYCATRFSIARGEFGYGGGFCFCGKEGDPYFIICHNLILIH